jgi:hypothetical protein
VVVVSRYLLTGRTKDKLDIERYYWAGRGRGNGIGRWDTWLAARTGAGIGSGAGVGRIASVFTKMVSGASGMGDAEIGDAGAAALLDLPVSTTMTIKTASDAEAATTFINVGSHGRMLRRFCIVRWPSILIPSLVCCSIARFSASPLTC